MQLLGSQVVVVDRVRAHRRAEQHGVRPDLFHQIELELGPAEVLRMQRRRDRLEVAEGLVEVDRQPQIRTATAGFGR
jgi:hypothetical protein